jgi:DNA polymerase-3 subunit delta'
MLFKDIAGHTVIKTKLIASVNENRVSHAQLFAGPEGNGKLAMAVAYAQYISCTDRRADDSCGVCPSCLKYNKIIHPDLHFVFPVIKTAKLTKPVSDDYIKEWREFLTLSPYHSFDEWLILANAENQQAGIFAHESGEIIKKLNLKTFESEYKVMIIWMPEKMNIAAANKLLKMIEEPPEKTLFILVSENTEQIISTIRSRTQLVKILKIDNQSLFDTVKQKYNFADEKIQEIIRLSDGNFNKVIQIVKAEEQGESKDFENFTQLMRLCYGVKIQEITEWVDEITKGGRELHKNFLNYSLRMLRENFILNLNPEHQQTIVYLANKEIDFARNFSKFIHKNNIVQLTEEFTTALKHIERNGYDKLIYLDLALTTVKLLKINPQ